MWALPSGFRDKIPTMENQTQNDHSTANQGVMEPCVSINQGSFGVSMFGFPRCMDTPSHPFLCASPCRRSSATMACSLWCPRNEGFHEKQHVKKKNIDFVS